MWDLERHDIDLVVARGVVDVSGPRLSMRPVAGLPLIHVEKPQYHGAQTFVKATFDLCFAAVALAVVGLVTLGTAIAIKATSCGPVFFKAERMGIGGEPFPMLNFRSMVQDAASRIPELLAVN